MMKLKMSTNEEKPSVVVATDSLITKAYKSENVCGYQHAHDSSDSNIQVLLSQGNPQGTVILECAGRFEECPYGAGSWAFVALNENRDIIYADTETSHWEEVTQILNDYTAVNKALKWALSLPGSTKIIVATDSEFVVKPCPLNCECNDGYRSMMKSELYELMQNNLVDSISLIPEEVNIAAKFAGFTLEKSRKELEAEYENEESEEE